MNNWLWRKAPPVMERTLADDLRVGLLVILGMALGLLVFGGDAAAVLLGAAIGLVLLVVALNIARRIVRHRR